jgi:hypothetical protein
MLHDMDVRAWAAPICAIAAIAGCGGQSARHASHAQQRQVRQFLPAARAIGCTRPDASTTRCVALVGNAPAERPETWTCEFTGDSDAGTQTCWSYDTGARVSSPP